MSDTIVHQTDQKINMYYLGIPVKLPQVLDDFRFHFDPKYEVNEAHATLVAPFPAALMTPELDQHFSHTVAQCKQQTITASDFYITPQGYIFYTFDTPSAELLHDMYDRLHQYPELEQHKEKDHSFMPHITVGKFDGERYVPRLVRGTLPELCDRHEILFDRVRLYGIVDASKKREHVTDYVLSSSSA